MFEEVRPRASKKEMRASVPWGQAHSIVVLVVAQMRLSLSKKEVAEIHVMLTTLPIPPIPVSIGICTDKLEDGELKAAFEMATLSIVKDSQLNDGIVNAHSVFAALSFFVKWSVPASADTSAQKVDMQHKKDASLLRIISSILDYNEKDSVAKSTTRDDDILQIFVTASQEWVNTYLPDTIVVTIKVASQNKTIGYEHDMHIAMAHYCYAQGVLYNSKDSRLLCTVHDALYNDYLQQVKLATEETEGGDHDDGNDKVEETHEHIEIAKMYSQFPYHKMLLLCFDRLLKDCLYGHTLQVEGNDVEKNARDLLKVSFDNYQAMVGKTVPSAAPGAVGDSASALAPTLGASHSLGSNENGGLETSPQENNITTATSHTHLQKPGQSPGCSADMGSYKSSIGMFVLGIVNFLKFNDPYVLQNMCTSLRHLHELALTGSEMAQQACSLINIPALVQLVRIQLQRVECYQDTKHEIETILLKLETLNQAKKVSDTSDTLDAAVETLVSDAINASDANDANTSSDATTATDATTTTTAIDATTATHETDSLSK